VTPVAWPAVIFNDNPGGNDPKAVALTFDDGPDGTGSGQNNTGHVLDQLKALGLHATFFVCAHVWTDVTTDTVAQNDMRRIVAEGHDLGSHSYDHTQLDGLTGAQVDAEFSKNLAAFQGPNVLGPQANFTMYRVPYGSPFQTNNANVAWIAPIVAKYGVHVGWGIDADDWKCAQNGQPVSCIVNNITAQLDAGHSGPILMHVVYKLSGDALPAVVNAIYQRGYHIVMVQDFIKAKYGATSDALWQANRAASFTAAQIAQSATNSCAQNNPSITPPY
jgi:peptidoglycan/xylan/chitin deacetylase (PgdA/CDA1 family)